MASVFERICSYSSVSWASCVPRRKNCGRHGFLVVSRVTRVLYVSAGRRIRTVYLSLADADAKNWRDWSCVNTVIGLSTWMLKLSTAGGGVVRRSESLSRARQARRERSARILSKVAFLVSTVLPSAFLIL